MAKIVSLQDSLKSRLGSDLKFPIQGNFQAISGLDVLLQDMQMLLLTIPGERPFRSKFGCLLRNQIWENIDIASQKGAASIRQALENFEPRIKVISVTSSINRNTDLITFNIQFLVLNENTTVNLVFPFRIGSQLSFA